MLSEFPGHLARAAADFLEVAADAREEIAHRIAHALGEVALLDAKPEGHKERARFQAIEGKTWNHPVVAHGRLFVRNGEEAACFQLAENNTAAGE